MTRRRIAVLLGIVLALLVASTTLRGQTSADFDLSWNVIGNGGGESASADFRVQGTAGQALVIEATSSSAGYRLSSGFWFATVPTATPTNTPVPTSTNTPMPTATFTATPTTTPTATPERLHLPVIR